MKRHIVITALVLAAASAWAQQATPAAQGAASAAAAPQGADLAEGEVRKVNRERKKVTIKHGEIRNLDMPPMTMVFGVSSPELLDRVKAGDKVRFRAVDAGGGSLVITEILPAQ